LAHHVHLELPAQIIQSDRLDGPGDRDPGIVDHGVQALRQGFVELGELPRVRHVQVYRRDPR
jgi:hypothetical protein